MSLQSCFRLLLAGVIGLVAIPSLFAQETVPPPEAQAQPLPPTPEPPPPPPPVVPPPPIAPPPSYSYEPPHEHHHRRHNRIFAPGTVSLTTGAGVSNYFGSGVTGALDAGAAWDARVTFGTSSVIALEAGYVGSTNNFDTPGTSGHLVSNGLDGDLRLQIPLRVEPYIFGGVGYNHMRLYDRALLFGSNSDDQFTVPAGAGLTGYIGRHATLDLRGTYRYTPDNGVLFMAPTTELHQWVAQAHIGYVF